MLAKVGLELGGQAGGVAQHQRRHQGPRFGRPALHRGPQSLANPLHQPQRSVRAGHRGGLGADPEHRGQSEPRSGGCSRAWAGHPGPDRQPGPRRRRIAADHDQPRRPHPPGGPPAGDLVDADRHGGVRRAWPRSPRSAARRRAPPAPPRPRRPPGPAGRPARGSAGSRAVRRPPPAARSPARRPAAQADRRTAPTASRATAAPTAAAIQVPRTARGAAPGGGPARHGQRHQPQIVPVRCPGRRPRAVASDSVPGAAAVPISHPHMRSDLGIGLRADAVHLLQLLDPGEAPCCSRQAMMLAAVTGPTPGSCSSCAWVARLRSIAGPGRSAGLGVGSARPSRTSPAGCRSVPITICWPSVNSWARLSSSGSADRVSPPAASIASWTRAPEGSRTSPGRRTAPSTCTTISAAPARSAWCRRGRRRGRRGAGRPSPGTRDWPRPPVGPGTGPSRHRSEPATSSTRDHPEMAPGEAPQRRQIDQRLDLDPSHSLPGCWARPRPGAMARVAG